ncbi:cupin domain-containing protein [Thermoleophilia bacterium SCSIO 60948]|nr:cupin domain-containing protein [Thermoleophilia bacterium SCSIO 60948]
MVSVTSIESLRLSERAARFQGGAEIDASMFIVNYARGDEVGAHTHPYPELFVVRTGTAVFTVDGEEREVEAGSIVVVPAETPHGFANRQDEALEVLSVHPSPEVIQTDL